ncbi:MAG: TetR/AcrR family transcriptional regulator [Myxococcales bacterium]|nr:TetR/AcrR family transcriptional regulator [Myxococcales bacterium]
MPSSDHPRHPQQDRSRATVDAILDAAASLLAELGPTGTTNNRIAERAGVSLRSIHYHFGDKKALYRALGDRFTAAMRATVTAAVPQMATLPLGRLLPEGIGALLRRLGEDPVLRGVLHATALPPRDFAAIDAFERELAMLLAMLIQAHPVLRVRCPDPAWSARVVVRAAAGLTVRTLALEPELVGTDRFRAELMRLIDGYFGGSFIASAEPRPVQG